MEFVPGELGKGGGGREKGSADNGILKEVKGGRGRAGVGKRGVYQSAATRPCLSASLESAPAARRASTASS